MTGKPALRGGPVGGLRNRRLRLFSLLLVLVLAAAALPLPADAGPATEETRSHGLPAEGHATYEIQAHGMAASILVDVALRSEAGTCQDGFGASHHCLRWLVTSAAPDLGMEPDELPVFFSPDHAEFISAGTWDPSADNPQHQAFAAPTPRWEGFPLSDPALEDPFRDARRLVLLALTAQARLSDNDLEETRFADHRMDVEVTRDDGAPHVELRSQEPSGNPHAVEARYEIDFDADTVFPIRISLQQEGDPRRTVADAILLNHTSSDEGLVADGLTPLPFPRTRSGTQMQGWGTAPPSGDDVLFLPLDHADNIAQLQPGAQEDRSTDEEEYLVRARYSEELHHTDEPMQPDKITGNWALFYAGPSKDFRYVGVEREAFNTTREVYTEDFGEIEDTSPAPEPAFVPAKSNLPSELVTLGDAVAIGAGAIPLGEHEKKLRWSVGRTPLESTTASAAVYQVSCQRPVGLGVIAEVSAVNGQLLSRGSVFSPPACLSPP